MEALFFDKKSGVLDYTKERQIPSIDKSTNVLVRVEYSGLCGTDLHIIEGSFPCNDKIPIVLGHEFCGTIVKAGPDANFAVGQRVVVDPNSGCGVCCSCHNGRYHLCEEGGINTTIGIHRDGGWAQYCQVPDTQVLVLPDEISFAQGALCEPLSCLARGWDRAGPMPIGVDILILGAGIIGNLWAVLFHLQGHKNVTVSELNPSRLETAKKMNLNYTYKTPKEIKESKKLFDIIVDCTGVAKAFEESLPMLKRAGRYILFGCTNPKDEAKVNPFEMYMKESTIIAVNINPFTFPKAIGLLQSLGSKYLNYETLGIGVFPLKDYKKAISALKSGSIAKAVFKVSP